MLKNISIKAKLIGILFVGVLAMFLIAKMSLDSQKQSLEQQMKQQAKSTVQMAYSEGRRLVELVNAGELNKQTARLQFIEMLKGLNSGVDYFFAYDSKGIQLANGPRTASLGKDLYDLKDKNGVLVIKDLIDRAKRGNYEPTYYVWPKGEAQVLTKKVSYSAYIAEFDVMFGTGGYLDKINDIYYASMKSLLIKMLFILVVFICVILVVSTSIIKPLKALVKVIGNMKQENYNDSIDITRHDEIGSINKGLDEFKLSLINSKALEEQQRKTEHEQLEKAQALKSATGSISDAIFEIEEHITGISSSASELSSTLEDIAQKVDDTSNMTRLAEAEAEKGTATILSLNKISESIGNVVKLIQSIADKTNLLALNASIEAARAGDEGRGFAVVAEEVKKLAQQTRSATNEISGQIAQVQTSSSDSVKAIENISEQITSINSFTQELVISIAEQKTATNDISDRMEHASNGSKFVANKMKEIVSL